MKTAEEILKEFDFTTMDDYNPVFERMKDAINEARKEAAVEFFKWNAKHISEYLDYLRRVDSANGTSDYEKEMDFYENTTIEGRYNEFLKSQQKTN